MFELVHEPLLRWTLIDVGLFLLVAFALFFAAIVFLAICVQMFEALKHLLTQPWQPTSKVDKSGQEKKFGWDDLDRRDKIKIGALLAATLAGTPALFFCGVASDSVVLAVTSLCFFLLGSITVLIWTQGLLLPKERREVQIVPTVAKSVSPRSQS
jgi:hypothetical protein